MNLSIVVATYNASATLCKALDSISSQIYQDWECILVDGASKDDTVKIAREYAKQDSRFKYISEPDNGVFEAFNKGWRLAKGKWIYFLGADDELLPNAMMELLKEERTAAAIYGDIWFINTRGTIKKQSPLDLSQGRFRMISHQAIIMQRSVIEEIGGFDKMFKLCGDLDMLLKAFARGYKFMHIDTYVAKFADGGISSANFSRILEEHRIFKNSGLYSEWRLFSMFCESVCISYARFFAHKLYVILRVSKWKRTI